MAERARSREKASQADAEVDPPGGSAGAAAATDTLAVATPGWLDTAREPHTIQTLLSGIVAWATTVAPAAFGRDGPGAARAFAVLALLAGVSGPLLVGARRRLGRHVGLTLYLGLATLAWLLGSNAIQPVRLDPTRAAIGAVAWGVFALSWSDPWRFKREAVADPSAPALQPRAALPPFAVFVAGAAVASALVCLLLAWRIRDPGRAILGQGVAIACSVALVTAGAAVATSRGKTQPGGTRRLTRAAARPLILLLVVAISGAVVLALR